LRDKGLGFKMQGLEWIGVRGQGSGVRVQGLGFKVPDAGLRVKSIVGDRRQAKVDELDLAPLTEQHVVALDVPVQFRI